MYLNKKYYLLLITWHRFFNCFELLKHEQDKRESLLGEDSLTKNSSLDDPTDNEATKPTEICNGQPKSET